MHLTRTEWADRVVTLQTFPTLADAERHCDRARQAPGVQAASIDPGGRDVLGVQGDEGESGLADIEAHD